MPGFKDTWNPSLWRRHVAASSRCSQLILWSGAPPPPHPPAPGFTQAPSALQREAGAGEPSTPVFPELQDEEPRALGSLSAASPQLRRRSDSPRHPHPPLALASSLQPRGRSAHTGAPARGRAGGSGSCCRCRSLSPSPRRRDRPPMLRALRPPSAQPLPGAQPHEPREPVKQRRGGHGQKEGRGGLGRAGL